MILGRIECVAERWLNVMITVVDCEKVLSNSLVVGILKSDSDHDGRAIRLTLTVSLPTSRLLRLNIPVKYNEIYLAYSDLYRVVYRELARHGSPQLACLTSKRLGLAQETIPRLRNVTERNTVPMAHKRYV